MFTRKVPVGSATQPSNAARSLQREYSDMFQALINQQYERVYIRTKIQKLISEGQDVDKVIRQRDRAVLLEERAVELKREEEYLIERAKSEEKEFILRLVEGILRKVNGKAPGKSAFYCNELASSTPKSAF
ncbi:MAG: hypothetical protein BJ554DRAFT_1234 [Olpidium bornovanus]|uniref:Uncharacterized protein n=1 Tax=Olpidium bornovanus TaxID=278681 RepID=A0A8H7ZSD1_9FUNG|nr:MAG: hypothetical protein BJ554DRAFT_1234 [Olpidium bornovanus]